VRGCGNCSGDQVWQLGTMGSVGRCAGDEVDGVAYRVAAGSRQVGVVRVHMRESRSRVEAAVILHR
jgi:hypothetical protein